jgi:hypothetical protein
MIVKFVNGYTLWLQYPIINTGGVKKINKTLLVCK